MKECINEGHFEGMLAPLARGVVWNIVLPPYMSVDNMRKLQCTEHKVGLQQILPMHVNAPRVVYYENCLGCLYSAFRRQCVATTEPSDEMLDRLQAFINSIIVPELIELFTDFYYSFEVWYNHLTAEQQAEIDPIIGISDVELMRRLVDVFGKSEKQADSYPPPKNRCISALCTAHKYVMGPIVYALEQKLKHFKGYCGGKNWAELEAIYDEMYEREFNIFQTDISGMDRSIKQRLKNMVFFKIYELLEPYVHHVSLEVFRAHAYAMVTKMYMTIFADGRPDLYGFASIIATVFSGSMDTTSHNTALMAIIHRFIAEVLLELSKDEYITNNKGDDGISGLPNTIPVEKVVAAYNLVFTSATLSKYILAPYYIVHGVGMSLKVFTCGKTTDIDFCSTQTFRCDDCGKHHITRNLERFLNFTPLSNSVLRLSLNQVAAYKEALYQSNLKWMDGLAIFSALNDHLHTGMQLNYTLAGKEKKTLKLSPRDALFQLTFAHTGEMDKLIKCFGKADAYSMNGRNTTLRKCCKAAFTQSLLEKYGWDESQVQTIHHTILNANNCYVSDLLVAGLQHNELRIKLLSVG